MNFWQTLPKPILAVAPMADVTDAAFRRLIAKYSDWDSLDNVVMWTEFVAADGLMRATPEGKAKLMADLIYTEDERPIVAQLFTSNEAHMEAAARLCAELGYDGIDINMGCPDRSIEKQGCGSAMIKTPEVAQKIIRAAKRGAGGVPVSVKTRIGYATDEIDTWIPMLLKEQPAALTVHLRTRKQLSKVPADWSFMPRIVKLRDELSPETIVLGNGDVLSAEDGRLKATLSGADGVMVGRALFGNPWFFHPTTRLPLRLKALPTHGVNRETLVREDVADTSVTYVTLKERLEVLIEHTNLFTDLLPHKNFAVMKKHYKAYVNGFPCASDLRVELMEASSVEVVEEVVHRFLETNPTLHAWVATLES